MKRKDNKDSRERRAFQAALVHILNERGYGSATAIAIESGCPDSTISDLRSGKKGGSVKTQADIARAAGYSYVDFLTLGTRILDKESTEQGRLLADKDNAASVLGIDSGSIIERMRTELELYNDLCETQKKTIALLEEKLAKYELATMEGAGIHKFSVGD